MKFFISFGLVLTLLWAFDVVICKSPSIVIWNTCFLIINSIHAIALIKKHFPTFLPSKLVTYYKTVFKPLKISKKDFNTLIKGAKIETYIYGRHFCQGYQSKVWFWKNLLVQSSWITLPHIYFKQIGHNMFQICLSTGYSFWDGLHKFLHKFTWIVLSVHKLNKLGKFW